MRLRLRGPGGSSVVTLEESDTVGHLQSLIREKTSVQEFDAKIGYPPEPLSFDQYSNSTKISELDLKLDNAQILVSPKEAPRPQEDLTSVAPASVPKPSPAAKSQRPAVSSPTGPLNLERKSNKKMDSDPPEIPVPARGATLVLRIMPDDNSCMFRAFGTAYMGSVDSMTELRSVIAQTIQAKPDKYPAVVLDQPPDEYCKWIMTEYSWGGAIELGILSEYFDVEICSIDVQTLRVDRFNEGRPQRVMLVYSGVHYDTIALSPSDPPHTHATNPPDFDTKVFDSDDDELMQKALQLAKVLQGKHYFTDTAHFSIKCNVCGELLVGEKGATAHASETGHYDFGEAEG
ncbi:MAG: hypothetical protein M4579_006572 [Chaenotheca gracillima]|nr:MAG: hypothetical protein M4579_006572 [Chaenotheca gracillima]